MTRTILAAALALLSASVMAQDGGRQQYVSDNISVTIRDAPRNDAAAVGAVSSGTKVTVVEKLGDQSFARIRTADGRTGWITARLLSDEPAAKDRVEDTQKQLTQAKDRIKSLQAELDGAKTRLEEAKPAFEMAGDNEKLRAELAAAQQESAGAQSRFNEERAKRRTLVTGAGLVGAGVVLGLLLPWIGSSKRRRRSDF